MSLSQHERHDRYNPWFRIGSLDIGSAALLSLLGVASLVVWAIEGVGGPIMAKLSLEPDKVFSGEVWRVVTWPFFVGQMSLWIVLTLALLWYFGADLERHLGRVRMAWMLAGFTLSLSIVALVLKLVFPGLAGGLGGLYLIQFALILTWIAEWPQRKMFFGIPAWVLGAVFLGLQTLQFVGNRDIIGLLTLLCGLVLCAVVARTAGVLTDYQWIPVLPVPGAAHGPKKKRKPGKRHLQSVPSSADGPYGAASAGTAAGAAAPKSDKAAVQRESDMARLDELLDKIGDTGMDSLSERERKELMKLRERVRK